MKFTSLLTALICYCYLLLPFASYLSETTFAHFRKVYVNNCLSLPDKTPYIADYFPSKTITSLFWNKLKYWTDTKRIALLTAWSTIYFEERIQIICCKYSRTRWWTTWKGYKYKFRIVNLELPEVPELIIECHLNRKIEL